MIYRIADAPIVAINLDRCEALLADGRSTPFQTMFDELGDHTDDVGAAVVATVCHPDNNDVVMIIELAQYEKATKH